MNLCISLTLSCQKWIQKKKKKQIKQQMTDFIFLTLKSLEVGSPRLVMQLCDALIHLDFF